MEYYLISFKKVILYFHNLSEINKMAQNSSDNIYQIISLEKSHFVDSIDETLVFNKLEAAIADGWHPVIILNRETEMIFYYFDDEEFKEKSLRKSFIEEVLYDDGYYEIDPDGYVIEESMKYPDLKSYVKTLPVNVVIV